LLPTVENGKLKKFNISWNTFNHFTVSLIVSQVESGHLMNIVENNEKSTYRPLDDFAQIASH
jgi:hypothetical protein